MTTQDVKEFAELLTAVSELKGKPLSKMAITIYFEAMKDCTIEQVRDAMSSAVQTHKYAGVPTPAELREYIFAGADLLAAVAWDSARTSIELHGSYESIAFADPVISTVILSLGGWPQFCADFSELDSKGQSFYAREFQRLYMLYQKRGDCKQVTLLGRFDNENAFNGYLDTETFTLRLPGGNQKQIQINMVGFDRKQLPPPIASGAKRLSGGFTKIGDMGNG